MYVRIVTTGEKLYGIFPKITMMLEYRSLISQLSGIFPHICLQFALGTLMGYNVVLIAELHKEDSEIPTSLDQLTWFASLDIVVLAGTMVTGLLIHRLGNRMVALTASLAFVVSLLLFYCATTTLLIFAGRVLKSLVAVYPLSIPYISEVSEPRLRGPLLAVAKLALTVGTFFSMLLGSLVYWRTIALVNLFFPILAAVTVLVTPNSPTWLASKGRLTEAEEALCWLRGWVEPQQVQTEFRALIESVEKSSRSASDKTTIWRDIFCQRSCRRPLCAMSLISLLYYFSGTNAIESFATVVFRKLDSPIEESTATAIMGATGVLGNLITLLFVHRTGKRKLVFTSVIAIGLCQAIVATVGLLELRDEYLWVPPIAVIVANFANTAGVGAVLYMIVGEIFPSSVRYIGTSLVTAVRMILKSATNKLFLHVVEAITLPGVFLIFALVNLVALVAYYCLLPETEGRSLKEIEDHYRGDDNAKKPSR